MSASQPRRVTSFLVLAVAFGVLDAIWLNSTADPLYRAQLGALMRAEFDFRPVAIFYPLYLVGVFALAVLPGLVERRVAGATWRGALFGLVAYATYDLTNQATIAGWSWTVTAVDLVWGTVATGTAATLAAWAGLRR
ncbi:MAG: DUF2177 family protein [Alphaproteobacteria bacterium]|nr:DUF2177 family protein [Alphaproteobacteria bacterium]